MQSVIDQLVTSFKACAFLVVLSGCASLTDKRSESEIRRDKVRKKLEAENRPTLVREIANAKQLSFAEIKNIGLVTNLADTGGPVDPSAQREKILDTMRRNDVPDPNRLLDAKSTAMILASARIPPAVQIGDRINVAIELSSHSQASDLRQGWLRETPLMEIAQFEGKVRTSFDFAKAEGSLVTNAQFSGSTDPLAKLQAVVVGGAKSLKSRDLGLAVIDDFADALTMAAVIPAINKRFSYFDGRTQKGVATPMSDQYIDIRVPNRYLQDPHHYLQVILRISFNETSEQRSRRLERLTDELKNAATVREACLQLEAIGESGADILATHLSNPDPEIRFYCAHALAYIGDLRAIAPLKESISTQAAFRAMGLWALNSMDNYQAEQALKELLHDADPEARYGAVRALRRRNPRDPLVAAQIIPQLGGLLEIPSSGSSVVAVSMFETPEVVFFGEVPQLALPSFHNVNPNILVQPAGPNAVTVTRFVPDEDDATVRCRSDLRSVLHAIGQVGGGYGDWVSFVRECQELGFINVPVAQNPVPTTGRVFDRSTGTSLEMPPQEVSEIENRSQQPVEDSVWYKPWTWQKPTQE
jgi:Flagellar P-ring protein